MIRSHCQKLRVVEKLSGAHLLIPSESSLAVRAYFPCDLEDHSVASGYCKSDDFDNLHAFLNSFKLALVLFILPLDKQREQLDNPSSFLHRAQRLVRSVTISADANAVSRRICSIYCEKYTPLTSRFLDIIGQDYSRLSPIGHQKRYNDLDISLQCHEKEGSQTRLL
jgi:hypothetical protein